MKSKGPTVVSVIGVEASFVGGIQYWARELSRALGELDWNSVLCFAGPPSDEVRRFLDLPNVTLESFEESWVLAAGPTKRFAEILFRHRPAIVHLQFTGFIGAYPWLSKFAGVDKIFFTDHGSRAEGFVGQRKPLWRRLATRVVNRPIDEVFCVSDYVRQALATVDIFPAERIRTVYNSIDIDHFGENFPDGSEFRRKHGIPANRIVIAQMSSIVPDKGIEDLLEAARLVLAAAPDSHFLLMGEGESRERYTALANQFGIGGHVTWTGTVRDPLAEGAFASAAIVCQMSRWEEAFGLVIVEAMAQSKPMVATRAGGIPEVVEDGGSGFLVNRRDPAQAAGKILTLLNDPDLRQRMGRRGRQIVTEKFDLKKNVAQVVKSYGLLPP